MIHNIGFSDCGDTDVIAYNHQTTALGTGIDMSAFTGVSAIIADRVFRDPDGILGTDNYPHDGIGLSFDLHYKRCRMGSASPEGG